MSMDHLLACEGHKCVFAHFCAAFSYDVILHFNFMLLHDGTCTKQVKSCIKKNVCTLNPASLQGKNGKRCWSLKFDC